VANRPAPHAYSTTRHLILLLWDVDPLCCRIRQSPMRATAAIENRGVVEEILCHLGAAAQTAADGWLGTLYLLLAARAITRLERPPPV
jgi:hypothetical protein